ncbi:MAG TPA: GTP cyclohydrolase II [Candidatus Thermoplasmatota archaeon]|nr:GTP cyclohydrolase II [Candidatus Thermoplasmatota archaeon]
MTKMRRNAVRAAAARLPTRHGEFRVVVYRDVPTGKEHAAIVKGDVAEGGGKRILCRIHSECLTGDIFRSLRCDCGPQLEESMRRIEKEGRGLVLYLRQEGRDIGLTSKILAYELQEQGLDTVEANLQLGHPVDARSYDAARDILEDLGVTSLRLLTNNPAKVEALERLGFPVVERIPLEVPATPFNRAYLEAKRDKMGHLLDKV